MIHSDRDGSSSRDAENSLLFSGRVGFIVDPKNAVRQLPTRILRSHLRFDAVVQKFFYVAAVLRNKYGENFCRLYRIGDLYLLVVNPDARQMTFVLESGGDTDEPAARFAIERTAADLLFEPSGLIEFLNDSRNGIAVCSHPDPFGQQQNDPWTFMMDDFLSVLEFRKRATMGLRSTLNWCDRDEDWAKAPTPSRTLATALAMSRATQLVRLDCAFVGSGAFTYFSRGLFETMRDNSMVEMMRLGFADALADFGLRADDSLGEVVGFPTKIDPGFFRYDWNSIPQTVDKYIDSSMNKHFKGPIGVFEVPCFSFGPNIDLARIRRSIHGSEKPVKLRDAIAKGHELRIAIARVAGMNPDDTIVKRYAPGQDRSRIATDDECVGEIVTQPVLLLGAALQAEHSRPGHPREEVIRALRRIGKQYLDVADIKAVELEIGGMFQHRLLNIFLDVMSIQKSPYVGYDKNPEIFGINIVEITDFAAQRSILSPDGYGESDLLAL